VSFSQPVSWPEVKPRNNRIRSRNSKLSTMIFGGALCIALGYGLDDRSSRVRFPAGAGNISLHHLVHDGSGAHPTTYILGTRGSFSGGKAAGA